MVHRVPDRADPAFHQGIPGGKVDRNIGGVVISIAMIYLLYLCITQYGDVVSEKLMNKSGTWGMPFVAAIIAFFGNSTTVMLNAGDYSREMKDGMSVMKRGQSTSWLWFRRRSCLVLSSDGFYRDRRC